MDPDGELDYMSMDFIEKAKEFDKEYKIQKDILKIKKENANQESSDSDEENQEVTFFLIFYFLGE